MAATRVKICGITDPRDAREAAHAGASAIGVVFHPPSPRFVDPAQALAIVRALPPLVTAVGLFVDAPASVIEEHLREVPLHALQFHGNETRRECERWQRPYIKALRVDAQFDLQAELRAWQSASALLLDSDHPKLAGGSGRAFDWDVLPTPLSQRVIIAGGLHPENVADCARALKPAAIDVSTGVESSPGRKSGEKMNSLIGRLRCAAPNA